MYSKQNTAFEHRTSPPQCGDHAASIVAIPTRDLARVLLIDARLHDAGRRLPSMKDHRGLRRTRGW